MFFLSKKSRNKKLIKKAIIEKSVGYKELIKMNLPELLSAETDEQAENVIKKCRNSYLKFVNEYVANHLSSEEKTKFEKYIENPDEIEELREFEFKTNGITAGACLAILNYITTGIAEYNRDCNELSHMQNDIMDYQLQSLDNELQKNQ